MAPAFLPRADELAGHFGQSSVARQLEPARQMSKRILVWHQLDEALCAVRIQRQDFLAGHRRCILPGFGMVAIGERVLGIQLELVDLPGRQPVDQVVQRLHLRHLAAADVQHHAPGRKIRPIFHHQASQTTLAHLRKQLVQRTYPIKDARRIMPTQADSLGSDLQPVTLRVRHPVRDDAQREPHLAPLASPTPPPSASSIPLQPAAPAGTFLP